ncbi:MAG: peptidylprolyl isomerase [Pseudanabaena sp. ELA607]|jgi:parvulin-like peptidyl-prolyl isomerase
MTAANTIAALSPTVPAAPVNAPNPPSDPPQTLVIGTETIAYEQILDRVAGYGMLPQLVKEIVIDQITASVTLTPEEEKAAYQATAQQLGIKSTEQVQAWLKSQGMRGEQLEHLSRRAAKVEKYKQETWGVRANAMFLERKAQLDRVVYSLLCTRDFGVAQEVYFRVKEGEQTFEELARQYSQGPEAQTGGLVGPVELGSLHPLLAKLLASAAEGHLHTPTVIGDWIVLTRLEKLLPAVIDDPTRSRLITERYNEWLDGQVKQYIATLSLGDKGQPTESANEPR